MGPVPSDPSYGNLPAFPPPTRPTAPTYVHDETDWELEEAELAVIPRPINWYAILCRILGLSVIGCAIWGVYGMAQYPEARAAMIEWVTFGRAR